MSTSTSRFVSPRRREAIWRQRNREDHGGGTKASAFKGSRPFSGTFRGESCSEQGTALLFRKTDPSARPSGTLCFVWARLCIDCHNRNFWIMGEKSLYFWALFLSCPERSDYLFTPSSLHPDPKLIQWMSGLCVRGKQITVHFNYMP